MLFKSKKECQSEKTKSEKARMFRIEVTNSKGERQVIETDNAVILYGGIKEREICELSAADELVFEIADLITGAVNVYIEKSANKNDRTKRIAAIALTKMINDAKFKDTLKSEVEKIESKRILENPFDSIGFRPRF